ncbi:MAG TPA: hypothetical protein VFP86_19425 [bacterium]|nr:hypothetical protein [bacterium]
MIGAPGLAKRLWDGVLHRQSLGRIVIKFYPPGVQASLTSAPALDGLSRHDWHWLFLQHLAESLRVIEEQESVRLLVAVRALAEDFVSSSYWPQVIGETLPHTVAGAPEIIPEQPGGTALTSEIVRRGREMPAVRLWWSPPQARERLASSNLVLLVHVMKAAAHPLEQYELFKKITLFAEYCDQPDRLRDRATLKTAPLYAVVHADIAGIAAPRVAAPEHGTRRAPLPVPAVQAGADASPRRGPDADRRLWQRPGFAMTAATLLWVGLVLGAFFAPRNDGVSPPSSPTAALRPAAPTREASPSPDLALVPPRASGSPQVSETLRTLPRTSARSGDLSHVRREAGDLPRFRVVSGRLARSVAELRARTLADQGADAFVRLVTDNLAQLQYGAYRSRLNAEAEAWRLRSQGYTAMIVPW